MHKRFYFYFGKYALRIDASLNRCGLNFGVSVGKIRDWYQFDLYLYRDPVEWVIYKIGFNKETYPDGTERRIFVGKHFQLFISHEIR